MTSPADRIHELKCWPPYFEHIRDGSKNFEVRPADRGFKVDDLVLLREYDPDSVRYSGESLMRRISYVLDGGRFGVEEGFVVLGLEGDAVPVGDPADEDPKAMDASQG